MFQGILAKRARLHHMIMGRVQHQISEESKNPTDMNNIAEQMKTAKSNVTTEDVVSSIRLTVLLYG